MIGFNEVKTAFGVSFYVQRQTTYSSTTGTTIPYEVTQLNIGDAMNAATGVFTAPVNVRYLFSFTVRSAKAGALNYASTVSE